MANPEHLELLGQGAKVWNRWRTKNPGIIPDLSGTNLSSWDLSEFLLNRVNLSRVNLSRAILYDVDLSKSLLSHTDLSHASLRGADLSEANLHRADLSRANLDFTNLYQSKFPEAKLYQASLHRAFLTRAFMVGAFMNKANLMDSTLIEVNLSRANLAETTLRHTHVLGANFERAIFTGACVEDCNINGATSFEDAICDYIYLKIHQQERRPREGNFKPGEFATLFQQAADTLDLIFKDGIDWQAFFQSFQDLRSQYADQDLSIQGIEKKRGGAFVVRLEVPPEVDKTVIESRAKELYASEIKALEAQYEERLRLQGQHLEDARQTIEVERRDKATLMGVMSTMASTQQGPKYDMRGAQIAGGVADTVQGSQYGGNINNYGPNTEDITRLLTALRDQAQTFPNDQKDEALDTLHNLERDLQEDKPDHDRIGRQLKKLVEIATLLTDLTDFTTNVIELTEKLGIPIEQVQLPPSSNP